MTCISFWTNAQYLKMDFMHNLDDDGVLCMHKNDDREEPNIEMINCFESFEQEFDSLLFF